MTSAASIDRLRNAEGRFSMLAIDQRESLRQMLTAGSGRAVADAELERFKTTVVEALSSAAA